MFVYNAQVLRCVDGDTLELMVDLGMRTFRKEFVRLKYIDTPEIKGESKPWGMQAWDATRSWCEARHNLVTLHSFKTEEFQVNDFNPETGKMDRDSFGRYLGIIWASPAAMRSGVDCLNTYLAENRFGWFVNDKNEAFHGKELSMLRRPDSHV